MQVGKCTRLPGSTNWRARSSFLRCCSGRALETFSRYCTRTTATRLSRPPPCSLPPTCLPATSATVSGGASPWSTLGCHSGEFLTVPQATSNHAGTHLTALPSHVYADTSLPHDPARNATLIVSDAEYRHVGLEWWGTGRDWEGRTRGVGQWRKDAPPGPVQRRARRAPRQRCGTGRPPSTSTRTAWR